MFKHTHANYTKYPKIFGRAYWGAFEGEASKDINDNRNDFVAEFEIKGYYKMPKYMYQKCGNLLSNHTSNGVKIDHIETYKTKDNRCIIVNSPYSVSQAEEAKILAEGYIKYKPLYNSMATTYIYITNIGRE
jgi:regulation of enolase protein 1 (concanavalin A-like superfamily)